MQLNGFKYSYQTLIILFDLGNLFAHSWIISTIANNNTSIQNESFVCMHLNGFKDSYLTLIIIFRFRYLFAHCKIILTIVYIDDSI